MLVAWLSAFAWASRLPQAVKGVAVASSQHPLSAACSSQVQAMELLVACFCMSHTTAIFKRNAELDRSLSDLRLHHPQLAGAYEWDLESCRAGQAPQIDWQKKALWNCKLSATQIILEGKGLPTSWYKKLFAREDGQDSQSLWLFSGLGGWIQTLGDFARDQDSTVMNPGTEFGRLVTRPEVAEMSGCGWEEHGKAFWSRASEALVTENGEPDVSIWINKPSVEAVRGTVMFKAELPALARQIRAFPHQARTIKVIDMMSQQDQNSQCYRNEDHVDFSACTCSDIGTAVKEELSRLLGQDLVVSVRLICTACGHFISSNTSLNVQFFSCYSYMQGFWSES